jgi:hypothetical protein
LALSLMPQRCSTTAPAIMPSLLPLARRALPPPKAKKADMVRACFIDIGIDLKNLHFAAIARAGHR